MVANKLNEVAGKGWAWYSSSSSSTTITSSSSSSTTNTTTTTTSNSTSSPTSTTTSSSPSSLSNNLTSSSSSSSRPSSTTTSSSSSSSKSKSGSSRSSRSEATAVTASIPNNPETSSSSSSSPSSLSDPNSSTPSPSSPSSPSSSSSDYYHYASNAAGSTYNYLTSYLPSSTTSLSTTPSTPANANMDSNSDAGGGGGGGGSINSMNAESLSSSSSTGKHQQNHRGRRSSSLSTTNIRSVIMNIKTQQQDASTLLLSPTWYKMIYNPYIGIRGYNGRQDRANKQPQTNKSMKAVRNLLYVTSEQQQFQPQNDSFRRTTTFEHTTTESDPTTTIATTYDDDEHPDPDHPTGRITTTDNNSLEDEPMTPQYYPRRLGGGTSSTSRCPPHPQGPNHNSRWMTVGSTSQKGSGGGGRISTPKTPVILEGEETQGETAATIKDERPENGGGGVFQDAPAIPTLPNQTDEQQEPQQQLDSPNNNNLPRPLLPQPPVATTGQSHIVSSFEDKPSPDYYPPIATAAVASGGDNNATIRRQQSHQQQHYQSGEETKNHRHASSTTTTTPQQSQSSHNNNISSSSSSSTPEETASQLAEGTLRALRDLALDEAVELHFALQYWTERWERPLLSWWESGPWTWKWSSSSSPKRNQQHKRQYTTNDSPIWKSVGVVVVGGGGGGSGGYDHQQVGQKVSQIQAVLARRLSTIGELQQHLLRAGWQRGVAQWGFLGEGGEWAQVPATDGRMAPPHATMSGDIINHPDGHHYTVNGDDDDDHHHEDAQRIPRPRRDSTFSLVDEDHPTSLERFQQQSSSSFDPYPDASFDPSSSRLYEPYSLRRMRSETNVVEHHTPIRHELPSPAPPSSVSRLPGQRRSSRQQLNQLYYTNLFVKKKDDGQIHRDDHALAEWSVDAMALIRSQLYRAANGLVVLPYTDNWTTRMHLTMDGDDGDGTVGFQMSKSSSVDAREVSESADTIGPPEPLDNIGGPHKVDTNLPAWASDCRVSSHLENIVEEDDQPLEGLRIDIPSDDDYREKPVEPPRLRKLTSAPNLSPKISISDLPLMVEEVSGLLDCMEDIMDIQRARRLDRLKPPSWLRQNWFFAAIAVPSATYLWYRMVSEGYGWSTLNYAARQILYLVREHVVEPCRAMYNELAKGTENISDRAARDTAIATLKKMIRSWLDEAYPDMAAAERAAMAEAMDITLLEETKEKALNSIYELNNVIRMSFIEAQFIKKEMMNALVALDEMQASTNFNLNLAAVTPFVLVMWTIKRVSQFVFYSTLKWGKSREETFASFLHTMTEIERLLIHRSTSDGVDVFLDSDDLGMLMLHLHELRTLLWKERRRFSTSVIRSVNEDLAELSGERGVVSVRQQLLIVERMARTYGFLKLASSQDYGH